MSPDFPRQDRETDHGPDPAAEEGSWQHHLIPCHANPPLRQPYRRRG